MAASHLSITLVQFDTLQTAGPLHDVGVEGVLYGSVGADPRAAGTAIQDRTAYTFVVLALHASLESAIAFHERKMEAAPWIHSARNIWSAVLTPIRHVGRANFLTPQEPGQLFDCSPDAVPDGPLVVLTTAGFDRTEDWMERARRFGDGVTAVRIWMAGTPGLLSTQSFMMGGGNGEDGVTVTFWSSFADLRSAMYGAGPHRDWMLRQKEGDLADRTSFTRCAVERSSGSWPGIEAIAL